MLTSQEFLEVVSLLSRTVDAVVEHPHSEDRGLSLETDGRRWLVTVDTGPREEDSHTWGGDSLGGLLGMALAVSAGAREDRCEMLSRLVGSEVGTVASSLQALKARADESGEALSLSFTVSNQVIAEPWWEVNWFGSSGEAVVVVDGASAQAALDELIDHLGEVEPG